MTYIFLRFSQLKKKHTAAPKPQLYRAPAESHTGDFLLTRTSDLPSALTRHFRFCGSSFAARCRVLCRRRELLRVKQAEKSDPDRPSTPVRPTKKIGNIRPLYIICICLRPRALQSRRSDSIPRFQQEGEISAERKWKKKRSPKRRGGAAHLIGLARAIREHIGRFV